MFCNPFLRQKHPFENSRAAWLRLNFPNANVLGMLEWLTMALEIPPDARFAPKRSARAASRLKRYSHENTLTSAPEPTENTIQVFLNGLAFEPQPGRFSGSQLGPPVVPFYPCLGEGSPTKMDYKKKGTLILTSLLEDLANCQVDPQSVDPMSFSSVPPPTAAVSCIVRRSSWIWAPRFPRRQCLFVLAISLLSLLFFNANKRIF